MVIGKSISHGDSTVSKGYFPFFFFIFLLVCIAINYYFNKYIIVLSSKIVSESEMLLIKKLRDTSFKYFSDIKSEEIYAALTNLETLQDAPGRIINTIAAFLTVVGSLVYLYFLSPIYAGILTLLILILTTSLLVRNRILDKRYDALRLIEIDYYKYLRDLLFGFKDIKMSKRKSRSIFEDYIIKNRQKFQSIDRAIRRISSNGAFIANYTWYFVLGIILLILPKIVHLDTRNHSIFIVVLVYIIGPVSMVTGFFPFYSNLVSASKGFTSILSKVSNYSEEEIMDGGKCQLDDFLSISLYDVSFRYDDIYQRRTFKLGPVDFTLKRGEVVFVIGGNGSGKSTFINLFAGLVKPDSGDIYYNEQIVTKDDLWDYRGRIAPVFIHEYLLTQNYEDLELSSKNEKYIEYLKMFRLDAVMTPDLIFQNKEQLSKGQQRRIALILALMTSKQILILDEWAVEQDPEFKEYFYLSIIPYLKRNQFTIIAVTHDEKYFSCADRVIKFVDGQIENPLNKILGIGASDTQRNLEWSKKNEISS
jgi:ABC-type siderophore export system fused ATPase/permease subunit